MKKILLSLSVVAAVSAVVLGATTAFYNDEETSSGNVLAAGAIDLGIDNESYYNGSRKPGTSWELDWDIDPETNPGELARLFFNFSDLKPGDWGEDTISLRVKDNNSWLCADVTLTSDDDNGLTEPEGDDGDTTPGNGEGELAEAVDFYAWNDDGDNVYETCERFEPNGECVDETLFIDGEHLDLDETTTLPLADSNGSIWGDAGNALPGGSTRYIGKAWCFGSSAFEAYPATDANGVPINTSPVERPVVCDGSNENNITQTDSMTVDITFRAEQSRHNEKFSCLPEENGADQ